MNTFIEDLKVAWNKQNSGLSRLIIINVIVFVVINIVAVFSKIMGAASVYGFLRALLFIPAPIGEFLSRPWTLFLYSFTHENFFHILFNMLMLYWFGMLINQFLGNMKLIALYLYGGIAGGLLYLLVYNTVEFFKINVPELGMIGASASVYAVITGIATLMPDYRLHLLLFGPVRLKYVAAITIFLSFIGSAGANAGGNIAHLGGAALGFVMIKALQRGSDWSIPIVRLLNFIGGIFKKKAKVKVSYRNSEARGNRYTAREDRIPSEEDIDRILDKISQSGYENLTAEEKQILFKASQKK
jgi:membrane associated rhomboid family serine protease